MVRKVTSFVTLIWIYVTASVVLAEDLSPPELIEFSISPSSVNVTQSSQVVTVTMRITDNAAGVETPHVTASSDKNSASTGVGQVRRVSGSDLDGIWEAKLTVPQGSTAGNWSVSVFPLTDKADNTGSFGPPNNFNNQFTVISNSQDLSPPELIEFAISPTTIDVSKSSEVVTVTMRITDNESGVVTPYVTASSDKNSASTGFGDVSLISGTELDGIWEARLTIPKGSTTGSWSVSVFPLSDNADNSGSFGPPSRFNDKFTVVSASEDLSPPELVDFSISPTIVDVTNSSQFVTVTMRITDNASGVVVPHVTASSDKNSASTGFAQVSRVSGTDIDGIWEAILTVPKGTTSGSWSVSVFPLTDNADNTGSFGPPSEFNNNFTVINEFAGAKHDTDGDGKADILWRNIDDGRNWLWTMDGMNIEQSAGINVISNQAWKIVGRGDFNGDGKSDILWRNDVTGRNYIYLMDGFTIKKQGELNYVYDSQWKIKEVLDLNGDGRSDIIWRHEGRGDTWIYLMDGLKATVSKPSFKVTDLDWQIVASGDVNNDGYADVIWRHRTRGTNYIWLMNGTTIIKRYTLNSVNTHWDIVGAGDINGDGTDDIIWRNHNDGRNWAYLMRDGEIQTSSIINVVANTNWVIADVADLNGDGKSDLFWQQLSTGQTYMYILDSLKISKRGYGTTLSTNWHVID